MKKNKILLFSIIFIITIICCINTNTNCYVMDSSETGIAGSITEYAKQLKQIKKVAATNAGVSKIITLDLQDGYYTNVVVKPENIYNQAFFDGISDYRVVSCKNKAKVSNAQGYSGTIKLKAGKYLVHIERSYYYNGTSAAIAGKDNNFPLGMQSFTITPSTNNTYVDISNGKGVYCVKLETDATISYQISALGTMTTYYGYVYETVYEFVDNSSLYE